MKTVYLYGPIAGLDYMGAQDWRTWMRSELLPYGIDAYSPLRSKEYLKDLGQLSAHGRDFSHANVISTPPAIIARDKFDVLRADMLVGNFLDCERVSIGSMFEQAWAHHNHIPVAVAAPSDNHPHDHIFFNQTIGFHVGSLEALRDVVVAVLG